MGPRVHGDLMLVLIRGRWATVQLIGLWLFLEDL